MLAKKWRLCSLAMSLVLLAPNLCYSEILSVPAGWTAPRPGLFLDESDGRDLLQATRTYRQESETWQAAYLDLRVEFTTSMAAVSADLKAIEDQIKKDNQARKMKTFWNVSIPLVIVTTILLAR